jgi:2'-5' RNA ligase
MGGMVAASVQVGVGLRFLSSLFLPSLGWPFMAVHDTYQFNTSGSNGSGGFNGAGRSVPLTRPSLPPLARAVAEGTPDRETGLGMLIPPSDTYASRYNTFSKVFRAYFDESLRDDISNTMAMRRDGFIKGMLRHRQLPTVALPYHVDHDDPEDEDQKATCSQIEKVLNTIPYFMTMKLYLSEHMFFGKFGSQVSFGEKKVSGRKFISIKNHVPVQGDKIVFKYDGTPGILVARSSEIFTKRPELQQYVQSTERGPAFFLYNPHYRKRFVIHKFEQSDFDYLFEADKASAAVGGIGLRDGFYWLWNLRTELMTWVTDALQRVGTNGMTIATYEYGNEAAREAAELLIRTLIRDSYATVGVQHGQSPDDFIHNIPVSPVGYDVILRLIEYIDSIILRGFVGQNLSSQSAATGLGSGVAMLQGEMFDYIIKYDAGCMAETLDSDLLKPILEYNQWDYKGRLVWGADLPFSVKLSFQTEVKDVEKQMQAASTLYGMGVSLDAEDLREKSGLKAPKDPENTIAQQQEGQGQGQGAEQGQGPGQGKGGNQGQGPPAAQGREGGRSRRGTGGNGQGNPLAKFLGRVKQPESMAKGEGGDEEPADPGVMIAWVLPNALAERLALPGGESPSSLHMTLCYLGKLSEIGDEALDKARMVCRFIALRLSPPGGRISGVGRFALDDDDSKECFYLSVDMPALPEFRAELVRVLGVAGVDYRKDHGFTPHVSIKYLERGEPNPYDSMRDGPSGGPVDVEMGALALVVGESEPEFFELTGRVEDYESENEGDRVMDGSEVSA